MRYFTFHIKMYQNKVFRKLLNFFDNFTLISLYLEELEELYYIKKIIQFY